MVPVGSGTDHGSGSDSVSCSCTHMIVVAVVQVLIEVEVVETVAGTMTRELQMGVREYELEYEFDGLSNLVLRLFRQSHFTPIWYR